MPNKTRQLNFENTFLYPKEKWSWKSVLRTIGIFYFVLFVIITPNRYNSGEISLYESSLNIAFGLFMILILIPPFNIWMAKKFKLELSAGIKALVIFIMFIFYAMLLPAAV